MNLELHLLVQILSDQVDKNDGRGVALSPIRRYHNIPPSTFYRAVKKLLNYNLIRKIKRDEYGVSSNLVLSIKEISKGKS